MRRNNESGVILPMVVIFALALIITGMAFLNMGVMEHNLAMREVHKTQAFWLADGGIEHLLVKLRARENEPQIDWTDLGDGDYKVEGFYTEDPPYAISTGRIIKRGQEILKRIKVVINQTSVFEWGVFGEDKVLMKGTPEVASYRSDQEFNPAANAKVGTNSKDEAAIELIGDATIKGDAFSGEGSDPDLAISAKPDKITGNRNALDEHIDLPPVDVPEGLPEMGPLPLPSGPLSIPAGAKYSAATIQGELTITSSGDLVVESLHISGSGKIIIPVGVFVSVYVIGDPCYLGGNAIENASENPAQFALYGAGDCTGINLAGTTKFYGTIYAPEADIKVTGTGNVYGALVGKTVELPGEARVYCDEVLAEDPNSPQLTSLTNWQELS